VHWSALLVFPAEKWRVQNTGKDFGSVVSRSYGFEDSPDAKILTAGFNVGKECGAVGVGRQGNFLRWGFSVPPSRMTEAGKCFFLNCICYFQRSSTARPRWSASTVSWRQRGCGNTPALRPQEYELFRLGV
jgi:hypothetical protein